MNKRKNTYLYPLWVRVALILLKQLGKSNPDKQLALGKKLGRLLKKILGSHRKNVSINLNLCFPEETETFHKNLTDKYFESFGMGLVECPLIPFTPAEKFPSCTVNGLEPVQTLLKVKKPIIFISAHFTTMIMMGYQMSRFFPFSAVFRLQRDGAIFNKLLTDFSEGFNVSLIEPKLSTIVKQAKQTQQPILYFVDQDHGPRHSVFAPFFNVETATIKALPFLAEQLNATIVPVFCYRKLNPVSYELDFLPPLENYPGTDEKENAIRINELLEKAIMKQPELYFWYYKRFRTRPKGEKNPYIAKPFND